MLDGQSSNLAHRSQNVALILLSLVFLPLNTFILVSSLLIDWIFPSHVIKTRRAARSRPGFIPKTILVTGVGMTKGLAITRLFYQAGHDVIGADFEPTNLSTACGRVSRSLKIFYRVTKPEPSSIPGEPSNADPYIASLLSIVREERVDLWISCSGVASAVEDGLAKEIIESKTPCRAIQFDVTTTQTLHEKDTFIAQTSEFGLTIPETHTITSRSSVEKHLSSAPHGRKYIMKTIGVDDSVRGDMTLLPKQTQTETSTHIARLTISKTAPWILQQFIPGREYCTHSIIVNNRVKAFVACPSAELLMHYITLPSHSPLSKAMLNFTKIYASKSSPGFTGHLSFDFLVDEQDIDKSDPDDITLYPIECNPRAHTAVALFTDTVDMCDAYLSALDAPASSDGSELSPSWEERIVTPVHPERKYYWVGHDFVTLIVLPVVDILLLAGGVAEGVAKGSTGSSASRVSQEFKSLFNGSLTFVSRLLTWHDGTYESWDPWPYWWLYQIYWPVMFGDSLVKSFKGNGGRWSRINVSTTKMFGC